jgi:branched-subunit amino acid transport protein
MTALVAALLLAAVCWVLRILLVVVVPADRLPASVQDSLQYLAPAVLASLVTVELTGAVRDSALLPALLMLGGTAVAAAWVRRTGSLALAVGIGASVALVIDLLLV